MRTRSLIWVGAALWVWVAAAQAEPAQPTPVDSVADATCRIVESAAHSAQVPVGFLTRLVWVESRFRAAATSPAGAQGIAQFMPGTAAERGLADPYDPERAIPAAAALVAELRGQFGNLGLAAAAYNAGPARVTGWLGGAGALPFQTEAYVLAVTGRAAADWADERREAARTDPPKGEQPSGEQHSGDQSCVAVTALLRAEDTAEPAPIAPWGVQLSGNFSKAIALASFDRSRHRFAGIVGGRQAMVIGTRLRSRGTRRFYRVLVPAASRPEADRVCRLVMASGGACVTVRT